MYTLVFWAAAIIAIVSAILCISRRSPVASALWLVSVMFQLAVLYVLLDAQFLAAVQVLVYIGAIAILIIFAVMLTRSMTRLTEIYNRQWVIGAVVSALFFILLLVGVILPIWGPGGPQAATAPSDIVATTTDLGVALVDGNQYVLPFEVASLLLTAAMIGAIVIARDTD